MTSSYAMLDEHYLHPLADAADRGHLTVLVRGRGVHVEDAEGRSYIDGLAGLWNVNLGHGREELVEAAADQMRRLAFANTYSGWANVPALELATRLEAIAYPGLRASFLATSGVDANEAAFKTVRYFWRRRGRPSKVKVISLEHGFHGATIAGMSATGIPDYARMFQPRLAEFLHVRSHYPYRCDFARPGEGPGAAAARVLEETIVREGPETVARARAASSSRPTTTSPGCARSWTATISSWLPTRSSRASAGRESGSV
jgi:putrescine---pyruvate transaminase